MTSTRPDRAQPPDGDDEADDTYARLARRRLVHTASHMRRLDRARRTPTMVIRRASGMALWERTQHQVDRDALVHRLDAIDERLLTLSEERAAIVSELARLREALYPVVPWCRGRRPPDVDRAPLPPAGADAEPLRGRALRATCIAILRRHGPTTLPELHGLLHRYGYVIDVRRPVAALSDALAYEAERGRARRIERGSYEATPADPGTRGRGNPPPIPPVPTPWTPAGGSLLDPALDTDPSSWDAGDGPRPPRAPPIPSRNRPVTNLATHGHR